MNVLRERYTTTPLKEIFDEHNRIRLERQFWVAVMEAQNEYGMEIPEEDITKFKEAIEKIDLDRINEIEKNTRHDVKAKIESFVEVAEAEEHIHLGLTSRDLTDNVEQMQIRQAADHLMVKYTAVLNKLLERAVSYSYLPICARTHHQPAQVTLLGRRFAMWGEELYTHLVDFEQFIDSYPLRGIKGPVGTQLDQKQRVKDVRGLENRVAEHLGFTNILSATGQVYPRSLDYKFTAHLVSLSSACSNFANSMRLMAGLELVTEGFKKGQVGSSAMPHKMNTRTSERIVALSNLVKMYSYGASELVGNQWEEGDVSCSALRRVVIPDICYAADGLTEATLTVLNEMGAYDKVCQKEVQHYLPFLASTMILTHFTELGMGREEAHEKIKHYAVQEALALRGGAETNTLFSKLAGDDELANLGVTIEGLYALVEKVNEFTGLARKQICSVNDRANDLLGRYPDAVKYEPESIL